MVVRNVVRMDVSMDVSMDVIADVFGNCVQNTVLVLVLQITMYWKATKVSYFLLTFVIGSFSVNIICIIILWLIPNSLSVN